MKKKRLVQSADTDLTAQDLKDLVLRYKGSKSETGAERCFSTIAGAVEAVLPLG